MKYFLNIVVYFVCFLWVYICAGNELFNYSAADLYCKDYGGLYEDGKVTRNGFMILNESNTDKDLINEGESAWISGYVKFSNFISWTGCYEENVTVEYYNKYPINESKLSACVSKCTIYNYDKYIGINKMFCYCLDAEHIKTMLKTIDDAHCNPQKPYNIYFNSTGNKNKVIHVYRVSTKLSFDLEKSLKQCIIAHNTFMSNNLVYETSSCYDRNKHASGIICINAATGKLIEKCGNYFHSSKKTPAFCLENKKTSWIGAYKRCNELSGKMLDHNIFSKFKERTQHLKDKYWMGYYRSFEVVTDEKEKTCLAVIKNKDKLILDPDDCSVKKKVICNLPLQPRSTTTVKMSKASSEDENDTTIHEGIFIAISTSVVVVLVLLIILIVKKVKKKQEHLQGRQSTYNADNGQNPTSSPNFGGNECIDVTSQNFEKKVTPKKPERQSLRQQNKTSFYENFQLKPEASSANSEIPAGKMDEVYDRIELKYKQNISTKSIGNRGNDDEDHVYDHTPAEDYDTSRSTFKSTKTLHCSDRVTYSIIERQSGTTDEKRE